MRIRMRISPSLSRHLVQPRKLQMLEAQFPRSAQAGPHRDLVCRGRTPWVRLRIALGHAVAFGFVVVLTRTMPLTYCPGCGRIKPTQLTPFCRNWGFKNSVDYFFSYRMMVVVVVENGDDNQTPIGRFSDDSEHNQELKPCSYTPCNQRSNTMSLCKIQFTFQTFAAIWWFDVSHC